MTRQALPAYPSLEQAAWPFPLFERLREECPVTRTPGRHEVLVTRHEDVMFVLRHPELFSSRVSDLVPRADAATNPKPALIFTDPPEHTGRRRVAAPLFSPGRLRGYEAMIRQIVDELVDAWIDRGSCEFKSEFAELLPLRVVCDMLGLPRQDFPQILRWASPHLSIGLRFYPEELQRQAREHSRQRVEYLRRIVAERHADPGDDAISELIRGQVERDGAFDLDLVTIDAGLLLNAGSGTTTQMLASMLMLLLLHPEELARVRADPSLIPALVEESLRLESPQQWQPRVAAVDVELGGVTIPAGSLVLALLASANRDGARFDEPDELRVEPGRARGHLAFSFGIHTCLGAPLARLEGRIAFERLLARLAAIELLEEPEAMANVNFRGPERLVIGFTKA